MTLVGVISDTHGLLDRRVYSELADCDHIIHAGDICDPGILRELRMLAPVTAVLGNNDFAEYGPTVGRFAKPVIAGVRFLVAHYPDDVRLTAFGAAALKPGEPLPHVCIHGHTHLPRLECGKSASPADFIVNPGSCTRPRGGYECSLAKMRLGEGRVSSIVVQTLSGDVIMRAES